MHDGPKNTLASVDPLLAFPPEYKVEELTESHPEYASHKPALMEFAPDFLGHWKVLSESGKTVEILLVVAGIKRQTLGWSLNFPDNGNQETFETLEQMRVRALDYLNQP